jgi:mono/diheme cytochrome c family protein
MDAERAKIVGRSENGARRGAGRSEATILLTFVFWSLSCGGLKAGDLKTDEAEGRTIILEQYEPDMPEGPGRKVFLTRCLVCHSARYVTMQPDFPPKVWDKLVHKMIKNFGAHITEKEAREIVAYLVSIKGLVKK